MTNFRLKQLLLQSIWILILSIYYFRANIKYHISTKVYTMNSDTIFENILKINDGWLKSKDALNSGVGKSKFYAFVRENNLERVGHGIYVTADAWLDGMYLIHLRSEQAVFSHETALF